MYIFIYICRLLAIGSMIRFSCGDAKLGTEGELRPRPSQHRHARMCLPPNRIRSWLPKRTPNRTCPPHHLWSLHLRSLMRLPFRIPVPTPSPACRCMIKGESPEMKRPKTAEADAAGGGSQSYLVLTILRFDVIIYIIVKLYTKYIYIHIYIIN